MHVAWCMAMDRIYSRPMLAAAAASSRIGVYTVQWHPPYACPSVRLSDKAGIPRRRHRHPREDRRENVRVGIGVVEFQLKSVVYTRNDSPGDNTDAAAWSVSRKRGPNNTVIPSSHLFLHLFLLIPVCRV